MTWIPDPLTKWIPDPETLKLKRATQAIVVIIAGVICVSAFAAIFVRVGSKSPQPTPPIALAAQPSAPATAPGRVVVTTAAQSAPSEIPAENVATTIPAQRMPQGPVALDDKVSPPPVAEPRPAPTAKMAARRAPKEIESEIVPDKPKVVYRTIYRTKYIYKSAPRAKVKHKQVPRRRYYSDNRTYCNWSACRINGRMQ